MADRDIELFPNCALDFIIYSDSVKISAHTFHFTLS